MTTTGGPSLHTESWGQPSTVLAIHGITANRLSFLALADQLDGLTAVDLLGRGRSPKPTDPAAYGIRRQADLVAALLEQPTVLVAHSMGAWVALQVAAHHPDKVRALVLVDGGFAADLPPGVDVAAVLEAGLGPVLARLRVQWPSREAAVQMWKALPVFEGAWSPYVDAYLDEDLGDDLRARCSEVGVQADFASLLGPEMKGDLAFVACPVHLLRAPRGFMYDAATDVPLLGEDLVRGFQAALPQLTVETVPDVNHYTIGLSQPGAAAVARAVRAVL